MHGLVDDGLCEPQRRFKVSRPWDGDKNAGGQAGIAETDVECIIPRVQNMKTSNDRGYSAEQAWQYLDQIQRLNQRVSTTTASP